MGRIPSFPIVLSLGLFLALPAAARAQETGGVATKENLDLPFDAIGDEGDEEPPPESIFIYGTQYEGDAFFFCCDRSGSMAGDQWKKLQREVVKNVSQFSERVQFAIVFYDAGIIKFPASGRPAEATPAMKQAAIAMVMSTGTGAGTCGKQAMITTLQYANGSTAKRKTAIFISDGPQTCNGQEAETYQKAMLAEIGARNTQRVRINTILIGTDWTDENFMRALAAGNGGTFRRIQ